MCRFAPQNITLYFTTYKCATLFMSEIVHFPTLTIYCRAPCHRGLMHATYIIIKLVKAKHENTQHLYQLHVFPKGARDVPLTTCNIFARLTTTSPLKNEGSGHTFSSVEQRVMAAAEMERLLHQRETGRRRMMGRIKREYSLRRETSGRVGGKGDFFSGEGQWGGPKGRRGASKVVWEEEEEIQGQGCGEVHNDQSN